jgi:hypothetical protein
VDENKLLMLRGMAYRIERVCGLCKNGWFPKDGWGTCEVHTYEHLKHTQGRRQLSIHRFGSCGAFDLDPKRASLLGSFKQFLGL